MASNIQRLIWHHLTYFFRSVPSFATPPLLNACSLEMRRGKHYLRKPSLLSFFSSRHVTWFATLDGALGHLLPVAEKTYRRLTMLMNVMTTNLPHTAGLNPKGFRQMRQGRKDLRNASRGIVDGDLVFKYPDLPAPEKVPTIIASNSCWETSFASLKKMQVRRTYVVRIFEF